MYDDPGLAYQNTSKATGIGTLAATDSKRLYLERQLDAVRDNVEFAGEVTAED